MLSECVAYHARARPGKTACLDVATGTRMTYAGLHLRSLRMAAALDRLAGPGAVSGARIAVLGRNSVDLVGLHLACRSSRPCRPAARRMPPKRCGPGSRMA